MYIVNYRYYEAILRYDIVMILIIPKCSYFLRLAAPGIVIIFCSDGNGDINMNV